MHIVDIAVLCLAAVFTGLGIKRGLILEAFRLLAVVGGFAAAMVFYRPAAAFVEFVDVPEGVRVGLGFIVVFAVVAAGLLAAGWAIKRIVHLTVLGWVDRLGGGCVGLAKCAIAVWALLLTLGAFPLPAMQSWLGRSAAYGLCRKAPLKLFLPERRGVAEALERLGDSVPGTVPAKLREFRARVDSVKSLQP